MLKQLLISLRILFRYRLYTLINLIGMATAIAVCLLIGVYVFNMYNYDAFNKNSDNIYRLTLEVTAGENTDRYATAGLPLGSVLSDSFDGLAAYANLGANNKANIKTNDNIFSETGFYEVNPEALDVFTFQFLAGNKHSAFSQLNSLVLTRSLAEKYFNSINVLNRKIEINGNIFTVTGIIEDWPANSHIAIKALLYSNPASSAFELQDWFNLDQYTYILLDPNLSEEALTGALDRLEENLAQSLEGSGIAASFQAQSLKGLYFEEGLIDDLPKGNKLYVNALGIAGVLILIISGLNYVNLSLTQSTRRHVEISMKKTLGIGRRGLVIQNGFESLIMTVLFLAGAAVILLIFAEPYRQFTGFKLSDIFSNWTVLAATVIFALLLGLVGNSYSGGWFSYTRVFRSVDKRPTIGRFKKLLLGFQFAIAAFIITTTLVMHQQVSYMKNKDLGFTKEGIVIINLPDDGQFPNDQFITFREKIQGFADIQKASLIGGGALPSEENGKEIFQAEWDGNETEKIYNIYRIDENYFNLLNIEFSFGRNFEKGRITDKQSGVIINEALARSLNWKDVSGKKIRYDGNPREIIGVVRDFHNKSLHNPIEPIVFLYDENWSSKLLVKTALSNLDLLETAWGESIPDSPFSITFFDKFLNAKYNNEDRATQLFSLFSIIGLVISVVGLFALFSLNVLQNVKEISVKKVLGASATEIISGLTKSYIFIIAAAIGVAHLISWLLMREWLESFMYKAGFSVEIFIVSSIIVLFAGFVAMVYHIYQAARINPAHTLKQE